MSWVVRRAESVRVAVTVNITFPSKPTGVERFESEEDMRALFGPVAEYLGHGGEGGGWPHGSTDVFLAVPDGEEMKAWAARVCDCLRAAGAPAGTSVAIFPEDDRDFWDREWLRVDVFGPHGKDGPLMMRVRNDYDAPGGLVELGPV